jgi:signal transduction histidine kinase
VTQLRTRLAAVHKGDDRRVGGTYPSEVQPLVDDLNALLAHQEQTVQRAVGKAGDLAHGLKTPLALLAQEAERAAAAGQDGLADSIGQQVDRMRRQIDHHLAQARAAASGATPGAHTALADSVDGLVRTMQRLYASKNLEFDVSLPGAVNVRAHRQDLDEMLGNLLDNACKWTASRIHVEALATPAAVTVTIDDDGPGIAEPLRAAMLQRGVRADEAAPGSGFGLAIVRDLAELYGGSVSLSQSPLGGLRAYLELPRA